MNNHDYLVALKKALSDMDDSARNEVLREVQGHIHVSEFGNTRDTLVDKFGTPEVLAQKCLAGKDITSKLDEPEGNKKSGVGKKLLMILLGVALLLAFAGAVLFYGNLGKAGDAFNYADEKSPELTAESRKWQTVKFVPPLGVVTTEAETVFYWHDKPELRVSCKNPATLEQNYEGNIHLGLAEEQCLVYLPKQPVSIGGVQGKIVIVNPQANVSAKLYRSSLKIAEKETGYNYIISASGTKGVADLKSADKAKIDITIDANESTLSLYE